MKTCHGAIPNKQTNKQNVECNCPHSLKSTTSLHGNHTHQESDPFSQGILERLDAGEVVIGDGGFVFALEKRGYVKAGPWTPEAAAEYPEAGWLIQQLRDCLVK